MSSADRVLPTARAGREQALPRRAARAGWRASVLRAPSRRREGARQRGMRAREAATAREPEQRRADSTRLPRSVVCCRAAASVAARHYQVSAVDVISAGPRPQRPVARARHVAMYIARVVFGLPLAAIGSAFGRDRTTVAYACRTVEDARDRPAFDAALARLELSATIACDQLEQEIAA